jgi:hypothetical protein
MCVGRQAKRYTVKYFFASKYQTKNRETILIYSKRCRIKKTAKAIYKNNGIDYE